jgi:superoxide dismutase, Fe-Mn family
MNSIQRHISSGIALVLTLGFIIKAERAPEAFKLPPLPYGYSALGPFIDTRTMRIHHQKHHKKYVDELNKALKDYPELERKSVEELVASWQDLPEKIQRAVRNNAGGHLNHSLFWHWMAPPHKPGRMPKPRGKLAREINKTFGNLDKFKQQFTEAAKKVFGSGWAWLCLDNKNRLLIVTTANQDNPLTDGLSPVLGLDVWEHAYYLKYTSDRPDYIQAWWNVVNWPIAEKLYNFYRKEPDSSAILAQLRS